MSIQSEAILAVDQRFFCKAATCLWDEKVQAVVTLLQTFTGNIPEEDEDELPVTLRRSVRGTASEAESNIY